MRAFIFVDLFQIIVNTPFSAASLTLICVRNMCLYVCSGRLADSKQWHRAFMMRLKRMYYRDKNHACIIAWSLGEWEMVTCLLAE